MDFSRQRLDFLESRASLEVLKFREHSLRKRLATLRESRDRERERRLDSRNATQQPTVAVSLLQIIILMYLLRIIDYWLYKCGQNIVNQPANW